ncbi:MAG: N-acetylmuramoyl-L-alanine amidase [Crocinitomicaceae bacterium]|nr:N-acetylmuramoyl-L-alanine amidase [Crocinitomicaceae bacterium]
MQVLKYTKMPTVLVECGFLTNASEATFKFRLRSRYFGVSNF